MGTIALQLKARTHQSNVVRVEYKVADRYIIGPVEIPSPHNVLVSNDYVTYEKTFIETPTFRKKNCTLGCFKD